MADDNGTFELSRRKALAGLGTIGAASAGAGMGTSAFFSDTENFSGNSITAGELDMKVGYSSHYSDWKPAEDGTPEDEDVDVRMYESDPSAGDFTGSSGDLSDDEVGLPANDAWLIAVSANDNTTDVDGDDDVDKHDAALQFLENTLQDDVGDASCDPGADDDDIGPAAIELGDVKPGDFGEVTFDFALCDNPGYVWLQGELVDASENGITEPEAEDDDEEETEERPASEDSDDDIVELLDVVQVAYWVDDGDNYQDGDETPTVDSLRNVLDDLSSAASGQDIPGIPLEGDIPAEDGGGTGRNCFSGDGTEHSVAFAWWVPVDHGNEIQGDSVEFDLSFYTEQCRHNDGSGQPAE
jgi:predicted ribosomally synthesized peptide with SipW-like signal peptide